MKSLFQMLLLLLASFAAGAQDSVVISGTIANHISDSVKVTYNDNLIAFYPQEYIGKVSKKGTFRIKFPVPNGIYIQTKISTGKTLAELLLKAGDSLCISADALHFDSTLHYTGRGSAEANFVARHTLKISRMNQYSIKVRTAINKEPDEFLKSIEAEKKAEMDFLQKNKQGLSMPFIKYWTAFYQYYNYFFMQQYPQVHEMVRLRRYTDTIPARNYAVIKAMPDAFNDTLLQVPPYLLYLTGVIDVRLKAAGYVYPGKEVTELEKIQDSVNKLAYKLMPDRSAEYFLAQNIYGRIRSQPVARTISQLNNYKQHWPASKYLTDINKQLAIAERLALGQPAPDIAINAADGRRIHLSDLKGKVVYLTFWAGWCKQCVGEMISGKKVTEMIRNKPLEFVYVSISGDTTLDNKIIEKFKLQGTFTNASGLWNSKEGQLYGVQSLPAYFLIDEEGNFAMEHPPTPSQSTELILAIEKLFR